MNTKYPVERFVGTLEDPSAIPERIAQGIRDTVQDFTQRFENLDEATASQKPRPDQWSRKETLGHLIDSASNNHQRFVRTQYGEDSNLLSYEQNAWVKIQQYDARSWKELLMFWKSYNLHLAHIVAHLRIESLHKSYTLGSSGPVTLGYIVVDYLGHMQHHLQQIERM